jgi:hypothetical protein
MQLQKQTLHILFTLCISGIFTACTERSGMEVIHLEPQTLAELSQNSDTSWTETTSRGESCTHFLSYADSSGTLVWQNSQGAITGIRRESRGQVMFMASYYPNGQLREKIPTKHGGRVTEGIGRTYYEDGRIQSEGTYHNRQKRGVWKLYDKKGRFTGSQTYDEYGRLSAEN